MNADNDKRIWAARWKTLAAQFRTHYLLLRDDFAELLDELEAERARTGSRDEVLAKARKELLDERVRAKDASRRLDSAEQRIRELEAERDELRAKVGLLDRSDEEVAAEFVRRFSPTAVEFGGMWIAYPTGDNWACGVSEYPVTVLHGGSFAGPSDAFAHAARLARGE